MTTVIKIGGSLIPGHIAPLCRALKAAPPQRRLVLLAGGGEIVDVIRGYRRALGLGKDTTYAMALLALDQHAFLLSALGPFPLVRSLREAGASADPLSVLAPAADMLTAAPGEAVDIDRATSDSVAALIAAKLGAGLVVLTDVDGIYSGDPKTCPEAALCDRVDAGTLLQATSLDAEAAATIRRYRIKTAVLNGMQPERLLDYLAGRTTRGTEIIF
ncbi:amino acid kinase family protein [Massilia scottii]|uniref:amino acid kinase family protein n=1 Tax=Massilia scottii TaxID=3057166 RepID=UPI002796CF82|nr:hypothetical protein [Massilia sp. CCM 9029]MDQ1833867.1 hypothetical protein [Massilia sp. CCM 9029]